MRSALLNTSIGTSVGNLVSPSVNARSNVIHAHPPQSRQASLPGMTMQASYRPQTGRNNERNYGRAYQRYEQLNQELPQNAWPSQCLSEILCANWQDSATQVLQFMQPYLNAYEQIYVVVPPELHSRLAAYIEILACSHKFTLVSSHQPAHQASRILLNPQTALLVWLPASTTQANVQYLAQWLQSHPGLCCAIRPFALAAQSSPAKLRLTLRVGHEHQVQVKLIKRRAPVALPEHTINLPLTLMKTSLVLGLTFKHLPILQTALPEKRTKSSAMSLAA